nr:MAG TPA: hypothetical protein [Bacteriophage sp.]
MQKSLVKIFRQLGNRVFIVKESSLKALMLFSRIRMR